MVQRVFVLFELCACVCVCVGGGGGGVDGDGSCDAGDFEDGTSLLLLFTGGLMGHYFMAVLGAALTEVHS